MMCTAPQPLTGLLSCVLLRLPCFHNQGNSVEMSLSGQIVLSSASLSKSSTSSRDAWDDNRQQGAIDAKLPECQSPYLVRLASFGYAKLCISAFMLL